MTIQKKFADRIDMTFVYHSAASTDITKSFKRRREQLAEEKAAAEAAEQERVVKVTRIKSK